MGTEGIAVRDCLSEATLKTIVEAKEKRKRRKKNSITPGKSIKVHELTKVSLFHDKKLNCNDCGGVWERNQKWIACDDCNRVYHLSCSKAVPDGTDLDTMDIERLDFTCDLFCKTEDLCS